MLDTWIAKRGISVSANAEARMALERTKDWLLKFSGRYQWDPPKKNIHGEVIIERIVPREGWQDEQHFWIAEGAWKEIHSGSNCNQAAHFLIDAGYLIPGDTRHLKKKKNNSLPRCYCVKKTIFDAQAGVTAEPSRARRSHSRQRAGRRAERRLALQSCEVADAQASSRRVPTHAHNAAGTI